LRQQLLVYHADRSNVADACAGADDGLERFVVLRFYSYGRLGSGHVGIRA
jgi:hypothetical protein